VGALLPIRCGASIKSMTYRNRRACN
jgi:hypothetical protein